MSKLLKKWGILIISIFFILVIALLCVLGLSSINKYKATIESQNQHITDLEASLTNIGPLIKGYVVTQDVRAGEQITEDNLDSVVMEVSVPEKLNLGLPESTENGDTTIIQSKTDLIDKYFKIGLKEGTVITVEDIVTEKIDNTWRYYDMILDETPIGITAGDYVDIRISFPFGEDFIAMSHKKVEEINSGILKLIVDEHDIMAYNSMLLDKALYSGVKIYAIKYVDGGAQTSAENFYPVQTNLSEISVLDPNILEEIKQEMVLKRQVLDNAIGGTVDTKTEKELAKIQTSINQNRNQAEKNFASAQKALEKRLAAEAKEAARASKN